MQARLHTAGEVVQIESAVDWVSSLIIEGAAGRLASDPGDDTKITARVVVEDDKSAFPEEGATVLTRGAWHRDGVVVFRDACASGFSLRIQPLEHQLLVQARYRPSRNVRVASVVLRSRFHLIARAVLLQYPLLWWAGVHGRAPLHVSAVTTAAGAALLAGPGGVGKSTLVAREMAAGAVATCDNLAVSDGRDVFGVAEPIRTASGGGRRVAYGRRESAWTAATPDSLRPDRVVVVRLGDASRANWAPTTSDVASRSLVTGTLMAGELRRYWPFAATLAAGTGLGPVQPQIEQIATRLTTTLPCHVATLSRQGADHISGLFAAELDAVRR
jgi:hypothetical protein